MDCGKNDRVVVELLSGHAEIFGTEMVAHNKYQVKPLNKAKHQVKSCPAIHVDIQYNFHSFKEEPSLLCSPSRDVGCRLDLYSPQFVDLW